MIKRAITLAAATALTFGALVGTASAHGGGGGGGGDVDDHGHVLLLGFDAETLSFRKCVDLAGGRQVEAHHGTIHTGAAGRALSERAGHQVVPLNGFGGLGFLANCAELEEFLENWPG